MSRLIRIKLVFFYRNVALSICPTLCILILTRERVILLWWQEKRTIEKDGVWMLRFHVMGSNNVNIGIYLYLYLYKSYD